MERPLARGERSARGQNSGRRESLASPTRLPRPSRPAFNDPLRRRAFYCQPLFYPALVIGRPAYPREFIRPLTLTSSSRQGLRLAWCSNGPTKTTVDLERSRCRKSVRRAAAVPWPVNRTASCSPAPTACLTMSLASCLQHKRRERVRLDSFVESAMKSPLARDLPSSEEKPLTALRTFHRALDITRPLIHDNKTVCVSGVHEQPRHV